jgi:hypothetical protein
MSDLKSYELLATSLEHSRFMRFIVHSIIQFLIPSLYSSLTIHVLRHSRLTIHVSR